MKAVEIRGLQNRVSMGGNFGITLIIGHYDDDVGSGPQADHQEEKRDYEFRDAHGLGSTFQFLFRIAP